MDAETIKTIVLQLPNFFGLLIALYIMWQQNQQLIQLVRDCSERKQSDRSDSTQ